MSGVRLCLFELRGSACAIDLHRVAAVIPRGERVPLRDGLEWAREAVLYEGKTVPLVDLERVDAVFARERLHPSRARRRRLPEMVEDAGTPPTRETATRPAERDLIVRLGRGALALPVDSVPSLEHVELGQLRVGEHHDRGSGEPDVDPPRAARPGSLVLGWVEGLRSSPRLLDVRVLLSTP